LILGSRVRVFPISLFENVNIYKDISKSAECRIINSFLKIVKYILIPNPGVKVGLFHSPKLVVNFWRKVMFLLPNIAQL